MKDRHNIKVITNDIYIAAELNNYISNSVVLTGGDLQYLTGKLLGSLAVNSISSMFISKAFINAQGIDLEYGYTIGSYEESDF